MALRARTVRRTGELRNHGPCLQQENPVSTSQANLQQSNHLLTLLWLADLHRDVGEGNLNRPWSLGLHVVAIMFIVIAHVHHATVDERVGGGVVRINLTRTDERITVPGLTVPSPRVSTTSSVGVGRRERVLSLNAMREFIVNPTSGPLGRRKTCRVGVLIDEDVCVVCSYARFLRGLAPTYR